MAAPITDITQLMPGTIYTFVEKTDTNKSITKLKYIKNINDVYTFEYMMNGQIQNEIIPKDELANQFNIFTITPTSDTSLTVTSGGRHRRSHRHKKHSHKHKRRSHKHKRRSHKRKY